MSNGVETSADNNLTPTTKKKKKAKNEGTVTADGASSPKRPKKHAPGKGQNDLDDAPKTPTKVTRTTKAEKSPKKSPKKKAEKKAKKEGRTSLEDAADKVIASNPLAVEATRSVPAHDEVVVETVNDDSSHIEHSAQNLGKISNHTLPSADGELVQSLDPNVGNVEGSTNAAEEPVEPLTEEEKHTILRNAREYLNADIRLISACKDEQQTSDCSNVVKRFGLRKSLWASQTSGFDGGACTSALLKTLYEHHKDPELSDSPKWIDLLYAIRGELKEKGYKQIPVLTSSRPVSMKDEFKIIPKNHNGKKRALVIGIRYTDTPWELPGCHNDCHNMIKFLKTVHDFTDDDITILMDDGVHTSPTKENILKAFHRFSFAVKAGDAAFFHFSGHGTSSKVDKSGNEESGFDQALMPVDVKEKGDIIDDEIFRVLLIPLPRGLQLTAIVDCCHSGTIFDLPFEFIGDSNYEATSEMNFRKVTFPHMEMVRAERRRIQSMKQGNDSTSFIERQMLVPPKPEVIEKENTVQEPVKKMKLAVVDEDNDDEEEETPGHREKAKDSVSLIALGCCLLLCLNPRKLFQ